MTRAIARARHGRAMHPIGSPLHGELRCTAGSPLLGLLGERLPVAARLSKGAGLPGAWPDVLGLAVRLPGPVDLLFSTVGPLRIPFPRANWGTGRYDSIAPYRLDGELTWLAAYPGFKARSDLAELRGELEFVIAASGLVGRGHAVATLSLRPGGDEVEAFDPMRNSHPGMPLAPRWFVRLRERAYAGSREGRGASLA